MFDYDRTLDVLQDFKHLSSKKRRKVMITLFYDDDFMTWLFQPEKAANLTEMVSAMYAEFTKEHTMQAMIDAIDYEGPHEFTRSHATFLTTVANIAIQNNNDFLKEIEIGRKNGDYSRKESARLCEGINEINDTVAKLLKRARKIIKRDATAIARDSRLPRYITIAAMTSVPEPKYIDRFKIGYYLNNLFNTIYSDVEENGEFEHGVRWRVFFKEIFGKNNVVEVATFVLLEGVHRIDKYRNSDDVRECWDTLTSFALKELNDSPEQVRQQMIELYIKRIDRMFSNKVFDLRVNLLDLDEDSFPKLIKTIDRYSDKIANILSRGSK
jgi:hypothetical protein